MKKCLSGVLTVFLVFTLLLSFASCGDDGKKEEYRESEKAATERSEFSSLRVNSEAMEPEIPAGSLVYYEEVDDCSTLKVKDIIVYKAGSDFVVHRIIEIHTGEGEIFFITKGDSNRSPDKTPVTPDDIVGKIVGIEQNDETQDSGIGVLEMASGAMVPTIPVGALVYYEEVEDCSTLEIGDIIVYQAKGGGMIVQRIIGISAHGKELVFFTKGDSTETPDRITVESKDILGKVINW